MANGDIKETIVGLFRQKDSMKDIDLDENYFEKGVSSLTIVELQIKVEEELNLAIPTSQLMRLSTINGWVDAYTQKSEQ
ncbi:MAG: acyl carrier protein [Wenzhouxiangellaceae bacterium]